MEEARKPKILIVEDDYENQKFLQLFLSRKFEVEVCDSEETFYEQMSKNEFDIILMDISLRGHKDGLKLTEEIRANPKTKDIPIVVLTAHAFQRDRDNALRVGVDTFLTKPIMNNALMEAIKNTLYEKKGIKI